MTIRFGLQVKPFVFCRKRKQIKARISYLNVKQMQVTSELFTTDEWADESIKPGLG
jgi:hypothetical protein